MKGVSSDVRMVVPTHSAVQASAWQAVGHVVHPITMVTTSHVALGDTPEAALMGLRDWMRVAEARYLVELEDHVRGAGRL